MSMDEQQLATILQRLNAVEAFMRKPQAESPIDGVWTPAIAGSGTAGTFTYAATTNGQYTRTGNIAFFSGRIVVTATAVAPTGNVTITGFPIVAAGILIAGGGVFIQQNINVAAGYTQVEGQILSGNTFMSIIRSGDNVAPAVVQGGELNATFDFQFWGVYRV